MTPTGQTASGTYTYYGDEGIEGPLPTAPNTVQILNTYGTSQASVSSGTLSLAYLYNSSTLDLSGGYIADNMGFYMHTYNTSVVNVDGGSIFNLITEQKSVVNLRAAVWIMPNSGVRA